MSRRFAAALVVGACCASLWGCGSRVSLSDEPPDDDPPELPLDIGVTPGSRLRPVVATAEGVASFLRWHDTELDIDCTFRHAPDGTQRCFPEGATVVFLDAECQVPAFLEKPCREGGATYGIDTVQSLDCDGAVSGGTHLYERSTDTIVATAYASTEIDGTCVPHELEEGETLVAAKPVAAAILVAASRVTAPGEGRLGRIELHASDGAVERIAGFDTELETICGGSPFAWEIDHPLVDQACLPVKVDGVREDRFADAACREPAARRHGCPPTALVARPACDQPPRYFRVGEPLDTVYGDESNTCVEVAPEEDHLSVGAELLPGDGLAEIHVVELGDERLRMETRTDEHGWPLDKPTLFDTATGYRCWVLRHGRLDEPRSDVARCVPPANVSVPYTVHTTPDCTSEAVWPAPPAGLCPTSAWIGLYEHTSDGCTRTLGYREVLETLDHDGSLYQAPAGGGSCIANYSTGPVSRLGELMTPESLPPVSVEIW